MDLLDGDHAGVDARQQGTATLCSEIERQKWL
jgi:hypothetical protein